MKRVSLLERKIDATREGLQATGRTTRRSWRDLPEARRARGQLEESGARVTRRLAQGWTPSSTSSCPPTAPVRAGTPERDARSRGDVCQAAYSDVAAGRYNLAREVVSDVFEILLRHRGCRQRAILDRRVQLRMTGDFAGAISEFREGRSELPEGRQGAVRALENRDLILPAEESHGSEQVLSHPHSEVHPKSSEAAAARERMAPKQ